MNQEKRMEFEKRIGYSFKDPELLVTALTHSSYSNEIRLKKQECNERIFQNMSAMNGWNF